MKIFKTLCLILSLNICDISESRATNCTSILIGSGNEPLQWVQTGGAVVTLTIGSIFLLDKYVKPLTQRILINPIKNCYHWGQKKWGAERVDMLHDFISNIPFNNTNISPNLLSFTDFLRSYILEHRKEQASYKMTAQYYSDIDTRINGFVFEFGPSFSIQIKRTDGTVTEPLGVPFGFYQTQDPIAVTFSSSTEHDFVIIDVEKKKEVGTEKIVVLDDKKVKETVDVQTQTFPELVRLADVSPGLSARTLKTQKEKSVINDIQDKLATFSDKKVEMRDFLDFVWKLRNKADVQLQSGIDELGRDFEVIRFGNATMSSTKEKESYFTSYLEMKFFFKPLQEIPLSVQQSNPLRTIIIDKPHSGDDLEKGFASKSVSIQTFRELKDDLQALGFEKK